MGAKVNPNGLRFGINRQWNSRWVAKNDKETAKWLVQDDQIRELIFKKYKNALVDHIEIERSKNSISLFVFVGQPGLIVGSEGSELKKLISDIQRTIIKDKKIKVLVNVEYVQRPELSARIVAREIADAIENRVAFRNAQKFAIKKVLGAGALGVKTHVSGRLGGVEMARDEGYSEGVVTLSTLRANIDYALEKAHTTYGIIGVKVWINKGEIFKKDLEERRSNGFNRRNNQNGDRRNNQNGDRRNNRSNNNGRRNNQNGNRSFNRNNGQSRSNVSRTTEGKKA